MKSNNKKIRNDIILICILCITAAVACFFLYFKADNAEKMQLQILIDGELIETYDYSTDEDFYKEIALDIGNTIVIENGQIYMKEANCPDGLCIKQGEISKDGQSIICLPHKLVVRLVELSRDNFSENDGLDVMPR